MEAERRPGTALLQIALNGHTLAAPAWQVTALRPLAEQADTICYGGMSLAVSPLARLLGWPIGRPRHTLIVAATGSQHALSVDAAQALHDQAPIQILPLPALLQHRLPAGWLLGVLPLDGALVPLLDLEAIISNASHAVAAASDTARDKQWHS
jgi:hypothetical protein